MRHAVGSGANRYDDLTLKFARALNYALGKCRPVHVRFDARDKHQVARAFGEAHDDEVILGPAQLSLAIFVQIGLWSLLGEIEKWIWVDTCDHGDWPVLHAPFEGTGGDTRNIKPASQGYDENWVAQLANRIPVGL